MALEKFGRVLENLVTTTAKKAGEQVQITKLGIDKSGLERQIEGVYAAIGRYCYSRARAGEDIPSEIRDYCRDIDLLYRQIRVLEEEITQHKTERDSAEYTFSPQEAAEPITFTEESGRKPAAAPAPKRQSPTGARTNGKPPVEGAPVVAPKQEGELPIDEEAIAIESFLPEEEFDPAKEAESLSASLDEALEEMIAARRK